MGDAIGAWATLPGPLVLAQVVIQGEAGGNARVTMSMVIIGVFVIASLPVVLGIRSKARQKELEHQERMRAIEMGRPMPGEGGGWTPSRIAAAIGVGVPIGVFALGWLAALTTVGAAPFIWPAAGAVGVAAVICGTVLAAQIPATSTPAIDPKAKPYMDPDAYDAAEHQHA